MPDQSEVEVLAQTAEWLSRLADTIERVTDKMADKIAELQAEQAEIRDGMLALSNRIEAVSRAVSGERDSRYDTTEGTEPVYPHEKLLGHEN